MQVRTRQLGKVLALVRRCVGLRAVGPIPQAPYAHGLRVRCLDGLARGLRQAVIHEAVRKLSKQESSNTGQVRAQLYNPGGWSPCVRTTLRACGHCRACRRARRWLPIRGPERWTSQSSARPGFEPLRAYRVPRGELGRTQPHDARVAHPERVQHHGLEGTERRAARREVRVEVGEGAGLSIQALECWTSQSTALVRGSSPCVRTLKTSSCVSRLLMNVRAASRSNCGLVLGVRCTFSHATDRHNSQAGDTHRQAQHAQHITPFPVRAG